MRKGKSRILLLFNLNQLNMYTRLESEPKKPYEEMTWDELESDIEAGPILSEESLKYLETVPDYFSTEIRGKEVGNMIRTNEGALINPSSLVKNLEREGVIRKVIERLSKK